MDGIIDGVVVVDGWIEVCRGLGMFAAAVDGGQINIATVRILGIAWFSFATQCSFAGLFVRLICSRGRRDVS